MGPKITHCDLCAHPARDAKLRTTTSITKCGWEGGAPEEKYHLASRAVKTQRTSPKTHSRPVVESAVVTIAQGPHIERKPTHNTS